jgi:hypothetical protein
MQRLGGSEAARWLFRVHKDTESWSGAVGYRRL